MRTRRLSAAVVAVLACIGPGTHTTASADDAVAVEIGTFVDPIHVAVAPGYPDLLFVVQRGGMIRVMQNEVTQPDAFLDIEGIVHARPDPGSGNEQGLLSVAFAPDYDTSGRFYVAFTLPDWSLEVAEFLRSAGNPLQADPASRRTLLTVPHPHAKNHNAGQLQFGPDGYLYISTGDGGGLTGEHGPRGEPARDLTDLRGKILRIDPLPDGGRPYRNPRSNPFVGTVGRNEIFAFGLRHPWRFSFDDKFIAIGDVGLARCEEVNILHLRDAKGANFGWPQYEGDIRYDLDRPGPIQGDPVPPEFPILTYSHDEGCAVIGGYIVRDPDLPLLHGRYIYGDTCTGDVRTFRPRVSTQEALGDRPTGIVLPGLASFGRGFNNKLYAAQIATGQVYRIEPPAAGAGARIAAPRTHLECVPPP
jgi:glucose/arabinose dehydrogenase